MDRSGARETFEFVECIADGEPIAVPLGSAGRWVECTIVALPLAEPWVRGLAVFEDEVLPCIGARPRETGAPRRSHGMVLEAAARDDRARWMLEVDLVVGMGALRVRSRAPERSLLGEGETPLGRVLPWLDVSALAESAFGPLRARVA